MPVVDQTTEAYVQSYLQCYFTKLFYSL